jgi:hypothetical protein
MSKYPIFAHFTSFLLLLCGVAHGSTPLRAKVVKYAYGIGVEIINNAVHLREQGSVLCKNVHLYL